MKIKQFFHIKVTQKSFIPINQRQRKWNQLEKCLQSIYRSCMTEISFTLYSKPDCSLCIPFKSTVHAVLTELNTERHLKIREINIDDDQTAFAKYWDKIPALEINGKLAFTYRINKNDLLKKIHAVD